MGLLLMKTNLLTTGQAAKAHSVTADTVLKWIKSGKLQAYRTAGGHYRIDPVELRRCAAADGSHGRIPTGSAVKYCWEHKGQGILAQGCRECIVYQLRAQRCYEVAKMSPNIGHKRLFCKKGCSNCEYYRRVCEIPIGVLVVTDDEHIIGSVKRNKVRKYRMEVADCGYSCCALMARFRPDYIVIDSSLGKDATIHLCRHLLEDARIQDAKLIIASKQGEFSAGLGKNVFAHIGRPFSIGDITACISGGTAV